MTDPVDARTRIEQILARHGCMDRWGDSPGEREELEPYKEQMFAELMKVVDDAYKLGMTVYAAIDMGIRESGGSQGLFQQREPVYHVTPPDFEYGENTRGEIPRRS